MIVYAITAATTSSLLGIFTKAEDARESCRRAFLKFGEIRFVKQTDSPTISVECYFRNVCSHTIAWIQPRELHESPIDYL